MTNAWQHVQLNEVYIEYLNRQVNEGTTKAHQASIRGLVSIKQSSRERSTQHMYQTLNRVDFPTFTPSQTPSSNMPRTKKEDRKKNPTRNSTTMTGGHVSITTAMGRKSTRQTRSGKKSSQANVLKPTKRKTSHAENDWGPLHQFAKKRANLHHETTMKSLMILH